MKPLRLALVGILAAAAACVPKAEPEPQPEPVQRPARQVPAPVPPPPPPPAPADWRDVPLTPGGWYYRNEGGTSQALYGAANSEGQFIVRCDLASRRVTLSREGAGSAMTIRTTSVARSLPVTARAEPLPYVSATLAASDRLLDAIAFSRGRFTVEVPGAPTLYLPAWPEPARVVEDCRA